MDVTLTTLFSPLFSKSGISAIVKKTRPRTLTLNYSSDPVRLRVKTKIEMQTNLLFPFLHRRLRDTIRGASASAGHDTCIAGR
jgi:hypothetical protein